MERSIPVEESEEIVGARKSLTVWTHALYKISRTTCILFAYFCDSA